MTTVDFEPKTLLFRTQSAYLAKSKLSLICTVSFYQLFSAIKEGIFARNKTATTHSRSNIDLLPLLLLRHCKCLLSSRIFSVFLGNASPYPIITIFYQCALHFDPKKGFSISIWLITLLPIVCWSGYKKKWKARPKTPTASKILP